MSSICAFQIHLPSCLTPQQSHMDTAEYPLAFSDFGLLGAMGILGGNQKVGRGKVMVFIVLASFLVGCHMLSVRLLYTAAL